MHRLNLRTSTWVFLWQWSSFNKHNSRSQKQINNRHKHTSFITVQHGLYNRRTRLVKAKQFHSTNRMSSTQHRITQLHKSHTLTDSTAWLKCWVQAEVHNSCIGTHTHKASYLFPAETVSKCPRVSLHWLTYAIKFLPCQCLFDTVICIFGSLPSV